MKKPIKTLETYAFSLQVALESGAQPNECFTDAWDALINLPWYFQYGHYVEGWIVLETDNEILLIEHGWCLLPDGRVVDPAIVWLITPEELVTYFAGVEYTWEETLAFKGELLPRVRETHGSNGMNHHDYKTAYETALAAATNRSVGYNPPKKITIHTVQPEPEDRHRSGGMQMIISLIVADE